MGIRMVDSSLNFWCLFSNTVLKKNIKKNANYDIGDVIVHGSAPKMNQFFLCLLSTLPENLNEIPFGTFGDMPR